MAALSLRAVRLNESLLILAKSEFNDEALALMRVLVEVAVNCGYLMITDDEEFKAFVAFPVAMLGKHHRAYLTHSGDQSNFTTEFNQMVETAASEAFPVSGRKKSDSSWTSQSVYKRAMAVEAVFQDGIFGDLATTIYTEAHDFVHGNFSAIVDIMDALRDETLDSEDDRSSEGALLQAAAMALLGCTLAMNKHFKMDSNEEIRQIIADFASGKTA